MNNPVHIRTIQQNEIASLKECLRELAKHHNAVSMNFKGHYPSKAAEEVLSNFIRQVEAGTSYIAVMEENNNVIGFCKCDVDLENRQGKLDYLVVLESHRGMGYGGVLMDWAMKLFEEKEVTKIEVKVVAGNEAIHMYEKYGFRLNAHILVHNK